MVGWTFGGKRKQERDNEEIKVIERQYLKAVGQIVSHRSTELIHEDYWKTKAADDGAAFIQLSHEQFLHIATVNLLLRRFLMVVSQGDFAMIGSLMGIKTFKPDKFIYIDELLMNADIPAVDKIYFWGRLLSNELRTVANYYSFNKDNNYTSEQHDQLIHFLASQDYEFDTLWTDIVKREKHTLFSVPEE